MAQRLAPPEGKLLLHTGWADADDGQKLLLGQRLSRSAGQARETFLLMTHLLAHLRSNDCIHPSCPSLLQQLLPIAPCGAHDKGDAIAGIERAIVCTAGEQQGIRRMMSPPVADCGTAQSKQPCTCQKLTIHKPRQSMFHMAQYMLRHHVTAAASHQALTAAEHVVQNTHN